MRMAGWLLWCGVSPAYALNFIAYGDMPYNLVEQQVLQEDIAPAIRNNPQLPFVIHLGDTGRPEQVCSDDALRQTKKFWRESLRKPVFFTPGDNDWTDCDRASVPNAASELARLDALRTIMFSEPPEIPVDWHYQQQPLYPENQRWQVAGVLFITLHWVANQNGRSEILRDDKKYALAQVSAREHATLAWLQQSLQAASDAKAIVIAFQADILGVSQGAWQRCLSQKGYRPLCTQLQQSLKLLKQPTLLLHGDNPGYCLDQPMPGAAHVWRLNAPGDYAHPIDVASITVDIQNIQQPFVVQGLLSQQPPDRKCSGWWFE